MRQENLGETIANSVTHGVGVALSIAGTALILTIATLRGGARDIVSASIYGATLVLLYVASTLYHALPGPRVRHVFRILDHSSIYLLIAGTYTPFTLVSLRGGFGWSLFGIIWGLAIGGVVFKSLWVDRLPGLSTTIRPNGMAGAGRHPTLISLGFGPRVPVAGRRRGLLHRWCGFLLRQSDAVCACRLARVCASRQRVSLLCGVFLRASARSVSQY